MAGENQDYFNVPKLTISNDLYNGTSWEAARSTYGVSGPGGGASSPGRISVSQGFPPVQFLNAVAVSTTSAAADYIVCAAKHVLAVTLSFSVAPTSISTQIQGSLDNINWFNVGSAVASTTAGTSMVTATDTPIRYVRVVTTITGGTGVSVTAWVGSVA